MFKDRTTALFLFFIFFGEEEKKTLQGRFRIELAMDLHTTTPRSHVSQGALVRAQAVFTPHHG